MHTYIPTYLLTYIHTYLTTCLPTYLHTYIHTYIHTIGYNTVHYNTVHCITYIFAWNCSMDTHNVSKSYILVDFIGEEQCRTSQRAPVISFCWPLAAEIARHIEMAPFLGNRGSLIHTDVRELTSHKAAYEKPESQMFQIYTILQYIAYTYVYIYIYLYIYIYTYMHY